MTSPSPGSTPLPPEPTGLPIAAVERDIGLSKDTLRVWERRYGFPAPTRDALGERLYPADQVERLRHVRRLLDAGHRAGQVVALPLAALLRLQGEEATPPDEGLEALMACLRGETDVDLRQALFERCQRDGLALFITACVVPMNHLVGQAWLAGRLAVHEEHGYTEAVQSVLRVTMAPLQAGGAAQRPRVLLATLAGENHGLGLLMAEAFLLLAGCRTVSMGTGLPLDDVARASRAHRADIVALGFTASQNPREVRAGLAQLRQALVPSVDLWAGGQCPTVLRAARARPGSPQAAGFVPVADVREIGAQVALWRLRQGAAPPPTPMPALSH